MSEVYKYNVTVSWLEDRKGILESNELTDKIKVCTPPEFAKGLPDIWSPEHLFVASAVSCFMTTFLAMAEKTRLSFTGFSCPATGILEQRDEQFLISAITFHPQVEVTAADDIAKAMKVLDLSHASCLILNSIKSAVLFMPTVTVGNADKLNLTI